jgi:hypothetical protein
MLKEIATFIADLFPPKPTFKPEDIPDLTGKIIIVTGANTGTSILLLPLYSWWFRFVYSWPLLPQLTSMR